MNAPGSEIPADAASDGAGGLAVAVMPGLVTEINPFWFIWTKKGHVPKFTHDTRAAAETEASRLAALCPGKKFIVLEAVSKVHLPLPYWVPAQPTQEAAQTLDSLGTPPTLTPGMNDK